jgi:hypothetical protein
LNGSALLVVFSRIAAYPQALSFNVYAFNHNTFQTITPNRTYLRLSAIEEILLISLEEPNITIENAYVFTYNHYFNLSKTPISNQTTELQTPILLDSSPSIFVLAGNNISNTFTEWVVFPQIPLEIGIDLNDVTSRANIIAQTYLVTINSAIYSLTITLRRTSP